MPCFKDMPASNNTLFYMFQNLEPEREYEVSVAMRNAVGEGPRAFVRISTPPLPMRKYSYKHSTASEVRYIRTLY